MFSKSIAAQAPTKLALIASFALLAAALGAPAVAAPVSEMVDSKATVIVPITIAKGNDLDFGEFVAGTGGEVIINTAGGRSATGGVVLVGTTGSSASFAISGQGSKTYSIDITGSSSQLTDGTNNMAVSFTSDPTTSAGLGTGTLSAGGTQTLNVGATLTVATNQVAGEYSGTVSASVNYN